MTYELLLTRVILGILCCGLQRAAAQVQPTIAGQVSPTSHAGSVNSKDDMQRVSNHDTAESSRSDKYSWEHEMSTGGAYSGPLEREATIVQDRVLTDYLNRVAQKLVRHSHAKVPFMIKVIRSDEINAFALPGGVLYINYGALLVAEDEAELASVMSHEIAHLVARHTSRQIRRSRFLNIATFPLIFFGGLNCAVQEVATARLSRSYEAEADRLAVEYLYGAGYDPQALVSFFERIRVREDQEPGFGGKAFSSHPRTADRIRETKREIQTMLQARKAYLISTSEFDEMKLRLTAREQGLGATKRETGPPTLRSRTPDDGQSNDSNFADGRFPPKLRTGVD